MNDTTVKAEKERSINITKSKKGIGLSVHYSGSKSNIFASRSIINHFRAKNSSLTLKRLARAVRWSQIWPQCGFHKNVLFRGSVKPCFLWLLILFFSWKFHWNTSNQPEDMMIFSFNMNCFRLFFRFFYISLLQRNYYFQITLNKLFNNCIRLNWCEINSS